MGVEAVLVDLGNTLITGPRLREVFERVVLNVSAKSAKVDWSTLARVFENVQSSLREVKKRLLVEVGLRRILELVIRDAGLEGCGFLEELEAELIHRYAETRRSYEDTRLFLEQLRSNGVRVAVVSNIPDHRMAVEPLKRLGLMSLVDVVVTSAKVGVRKPHPLIYLTAMRATSASHVVFVGDSIENDVLGALNVGLNAIHVFRHGVRIKVSVDSLSQALDIILSGELNSL
ncbi:MAG: HAD family hydrolase [Candidatus Nezhaarchaeota archaeon]|nr:HAD family hydrolase [Candidatus Nezhaarchaeota archaeon]